MAECCIKDWLEYHEEPVILHSGGRSHWLVRGDLIFADKYLRGAVLDFWERAVRLWQGPYEIISIPTGGDVWAEALQQRINNIEYKNKSKTPIRLLVDDVVTTGASMSFGIHAHTRLAVVDRRIQQIQPTVWAWMTVPLPLV